MSMSRDAELIKKSLVLVEPVGDKVAAHFYALLFLDRPHIRDMFPPMMDAQRGRLFRALTTIMQDIDRPEAIDSFLADLGNDHRKFDVRPEHYGLVGECLIAAMKRFVGEDWTDDTERAWKGAYELVAGRMIAGADSVVHQPPWWTGEIVKHDPRTADIAVVTVRTDQPLPYTAGQYVSVETARWPRVWRSYSMANAPRDGLLEFHVRAVGAGWVSSALVHYAQIGDTLRIGAARGSLVIDRESDRDIVLVGGGTGLAPLKAMIEDMGRWNRDRQVVLFFGAREQEDLYDLQGLGDMVARFPWLQVVPCVSEDPRFRGEKGLLPDVVAKFGTWTDHDVYVSGPTPMIRATVTRFQELGVPLSQLRYDDFGELAPDDY
jgi:NAD(P)H-flavin reductase/hemoglobin-like flavoprotein